MITTGSVWTWCTYSYPPDKLPNWPRWIVSHLLFSVQLFQNYTPSRFLESTWNTKPFYFLCFPKLVKLSDKQLAKRPTLERERERESEMLVLVELLPKSHRPTRFNHRTKLKSGPLSNFSFHLSKVGNLSFSTALFPSRRSNPGWLNANCYLLVSLVKDPLSLNRILKKFAAECETGHRCGPISQEGKKPEGFSCSWGGKM